MAKKPLEIGTKDECRHCEAVVMWGPPDPELPFTKAWYHPERELEDSEFLNHRVYCEPPPPPDEDRDIIRRSWHRQKAEPKSWCLVEKADYSGPCHAPVVDDELFMCGTHAKKQREYLERQESSLEAQGIENTIREFIDPLVDHLNGFYELEARPELFDYGSEAYRRSNRRYSGYIVVNPAKLVDLIKQIEEEF